MMKQTRLIRFGALWNQIAYEIFGIFPTKDDSIYVSSYRKCSQMGVQTFGTESKKRFTRELTVADVPTFEFNIHKISFHPSGYIHGTDKKGNRLKQFDGVKGLPFEQIIDCATLFSLYPAIPHEYRKKTNWGKDAQLIDIQNLGFVPLQITCYLTKTDYEFNKEAQELNKRYKGLFLRYRNLLPIYHLDLIIRFHQSSNNSFPSQEAIAYFTGFDKKNVISYKNVENVEGQVSTFDKSYPKM